MTTISIIVPAYNEKETILELLSKVANQRLPSAVLEVIVIDDGSTDGTIDLLRENVSLYSRLICQPRNKGKGAAVLAGLEVATGDYILFQDADLEYDPDDYALMFEPVERFAADIVLGSRFRAPRINRVSYFWHWVGNSTITFFFNILNNTTFTDVYSCYLLYRRNLVDPNSLRTRGWEQHAEILSTAVRNGKTLYEVPINYYGRTYEEGKKIRGHHAIAVIWTILRKRVFG